MLPIGVVIFLLLWAMIAMFILGYNAGIKKAGDKDGGES